jgi:hypothetical protein
LGPDLPGDAVAKWRGKVPLGIVAPDDTPPAVASTDEPAQKNAFKRLAKAQQTWNVSSLSRNKNTVRSSQKADTDAAQIWLESKIKQLNGEIEELGRHLGSGAETNHPLLKVVNEEGITITEED